MSINLQDIASISGMPGLYRIVRPTRNGVIVESLDEHRRRSVALARQRLSLLQEISIYTTDEQETIPLSDVMATIKEKFGDKLPVTAKSAGAELESFMADVVPNYDTDRVYTSDMKKLVQWYLIVQQFVPEAPALEEPETAEEAAPAEKAPAKAKKAKAATETETKETVAEGEEKPKAAKKKKTTPKE